MNEVKKVGAEGATETVEIVDTAPRSRKRVALLVAVPLPGRISRPLRDQLAKTPGATLTPAGVRLAVGPLSLLLTTPVDRRSWLVTGTVTAATLDRAAAELTS